MGKIRYRFAELVDIAQLQALMDRLSTVIGISNSIVDIDGTQLTNSGWEDACTHYHRANRLRAGAARQATPPCSTAAATSSRPTSAWLGGDEFVAVLHRIWTTSRPACQCSTACSKPPRIRYASAETCCRFPPASA